jgi:hypothetical protein
MRSHFLLVLLSLVACLFGRSASAQIAVPSQGSSVSVIKTTDTTMELRFGTTGTGQGRIVSVAAINGRGLTSLAAQDGKVYKGVATYGQGSSLGSGYVVYNGTGNSVTVLGLKSSTHYYITSAEYNSDSTTIVYNTRGTSMTIATRVATPTVSPLPVELTCFTGSVDANNFASFSWTTASERNSDFFALERLSNGTDFTEITRVSATGSSLQTKTYKERDPQQLTVGVVYYRLRQVDLDGTISYSSVVALQAKTFLPKSVEVYPNPSTNGLINLSFQGFENQLIDVKIHDALGRSVFAQSIILNEASSALPISLPQTLTPGTYFLSLTSSNGTNAIKKRFTIAN